MERFVRVTAFVFPLSTFRFRVSAFRFSRFPLSAFRFPLFPLSPSRGFTHIARACQSGFAILSGIRGAISQPS